MICLEIYSLQELAQAFVGIKVSVVTECQIPADSAVSDCLHQIKVITTGERNDDSFDS